MPINMKDKATKQKVQSALEQYQDEDKVKQMALYIYYAGSELSDVDKVIELAHEAMSESGNEGPFPPNEDELEEIKQ